MRIVLTQVKPVRAVVMKVAAKVRKEVQIWAKKKGPEDIDYHDLSGACGIASYLLHRTLRGMDIKSTFVMGRHFINGYLNRPDWDDDFRPNHCWVVVDGIIVDVTATQYGEPEEVLVADVEDDRYHSTDEGAAGIKSLLKGWDSQSPAMYQDDMEDIESNLRMSA